MYEEGINVTQRELTAEQKRLILATVQESVLQAMVPGIRDLNEAGLLNEALELQRLAQGVVALSEGMKND